MVYKSEIDVYISDIKVTDSEIEFNYEVQVNRNLWAVGGFRDKHEWQGNEEELKNEFIEAEAVKIAIKNSFIPAYTE